MKHPLRLILLLGRVIENICETRDIDAGAEVALLAQQHVVAAPVSTDGEWA